MSAEQSQTAVADVPLTKARPSNADPVPAPEDAVVTDPVLLEMATRLLAKAPLFYAEKKALERGEIGKLNAKLRKRRRWAVVPGVFACLMYLLNIALNLSRPPELQLGWATGMHIVSALLMTVIFTSAFTSLYLLNRTLDDLIEQDRRLAAERAAGAEG